MKPWKIAAWVVAAVFVYLLVRSYLARPDFKPIVDAPRTTVTLGMPKFLDPETNPNINVGFSRANLRLTDVAAEVRTYVGNTERIRQKLRLDLSRGNAPDLILVKGTWISEIRADGNTVSFTGIDAKSEREWLPAFGGMRDENGDRYAVPYDADLRVIWYRRDLLKESNIDEPGESWSVDEFVRAARALTIDADGDGRTDRWGFGVPLVQAPKTAAHWLPWYFNAGGRLKPGSSAGDASVGPKTLGLFADLVNRWKVAPPSAVSADQQTIFEGLAGGLYAMSAGGSWEYRLLTERSEFADAFGAAPIPGTVAGGAPYTICEGWHWMLTTDDPVRAEAATRLALFLASPDAQYPKWTWGRLLPVTREAYLSPLFRANPVTIRFAELAKRAVGPHETPYMRTAVAAEIATALQSVVLAESTPKEAWERVEDAVRETEPASLSPGNVPATVNRSKPDLEPQDR